MLLVSMTKLILLPLSPRGRVVLTLRRSDPLHGSLDALYPYDVTVTRREKQGFGFVIVSSAVAKNGSIIGGIFGQQLVHFNL